MRQMESKYRYFDTETKSRACVAGTIHALKKMIMAEKIIIADDHPVFRDGMGRLISKALPEAILYEAGSMDEVLELADKHGDPDIFLLDLLFPGMEPRETLSNLRQRFPSSSIMIVSMLDDERTISRIMDEGADAFAVKSIPAPKMIEAVMAVRAGQFVVARPDTVLMTDHAPNSSNILGLTQRQIEILELIRIGESNKLIARRLGLSPFTVRNQISVLLRSLNANTRAELAAKAASLGCLTVQPDTPAH